MDMYGMEDGDMEHQMMYGEEMMGSEDEMDEDGQHHMMGESYG
jgi:hypothetical protein